MKKHLFPGETQPLTDRQRRARFDGIFIAVSSTPTELAEPNPPRDGFLCSECMPLDTDISSDEVDVWQEGSHGWTGPVLCNVCHLSISVYVDAEVEETPPPPPHGNVIHGPFDHVGATEAFNRASELDGDPKTYEDAEKLYREALRLDPRFTEALINLGNLRYRRRDPFEAVECYRAAMKIDPKQVEPYYNTGCVFAETGTPARAIPWYKTALIVCGLIPPDKQLRADINYSLAVALDETGNVTAAREHWQEYIDLLPHGEWVEHAKQWLISTAIVDPKPGKTQLVAIRGGKA